MKAVSLLIAMLLAVGAPPGNAAPEGQMTWAVHTTLVPTWFDPAENIQQTPFMILLATHDALVKPMPGKSMAPSLAESWSASSDGLVYEFKLRTGVRFHNGEPVTAEDVRFSFERYRGMFAKTLKERVAAVEIPDPGRVRFRLKQPWPDFMTFYGTRASGAMNGRCSPRSGTSPSSTAWGRAWRNPGSGSLADTGSRRPTRTSS
jgi:peptide/nickel transport system substrate-binding protein